MVDDVDEPVVVVVEVVVGVVMDVVSVGNEIDAGTSILKDSSMKTCAA